MTDLENRAGALPIGSRPSAENWDVVVIGTGMGGATMGYELAKAGQRVLFLEKGRSHLSAADALRGQYPETLAGQSPDDRRGDVFRASGRATEAVWDISGGKPKGFLPFIGCGSGGSSALYGAVLERLHPEDFSPRQYHPAPQQTTLPAHWPIGYEELVPYYRDAEELYGVSNGQMSLPPLSPASKEIWDLLTQKGLHPYRLPVAHKSRDTCPGCQGVLCPTHGKGDSAEVCLRPALEEYGAELWAECTVLKLNASRDRVTEVVCERAGQRAVVSARKVVLAAGALETPRILLQSKSEEWPEGLANRSGQVGKNLMRHYVDLYVVYPRRCEGGERKEIGCNDLYLSDGQKLGTIQSFGGLPPFEVMIAELEGMMTGRIGKVLKNGLRMIKPILRRAISRRFAGGVVLASILEDAPFEENQVLVSEASSIIGGGKIVFRYRVRKEEAERIALFRRSMAKILGRCKYICVEQAENNRRLAHVCGTCRMGIDPTGSVVDSYNRAHGMSNLYIVDASFFPSSGGTNPALTVAANALRVARHIVKEDNDAALREVTPCATGVRGRRL
ncbi:GMC family oxidoreductase [Accumulibacter sp.]|uniref:FAD-dependent oxidoreductase n=1 Tax=Accumulibacter sp. TaxID=2053492 RepID=UPI0025FF22EF|nr:GMC family oxidoreductase [Accumulibacter sp.]MCM8626754.1 GMC family oxidoreductase [Accumulibacter sp.]